MSDHLEAQAPMKVNWEMDSTKVLVRRHRNVRFGRTRAPQNIRYARNRQVIRVRFKEDFNANESVADASKLSDSDDAISMVQFVKKTKDVRDISKLQKSKRKAQALIDNSVQDMSMHVMDRLKARKLAKAQRKRKVGDPSSYSKTVMATTDKSTRDLLADIGLTSNGQTPFRADDDEFDYVQVDDEPMIMDESSADILKLRDAIGGIGVGVTREGFSSSVLSTGNGNKLSLSPMKGSAIRNADGSSGGDLSRGGLMI